MNPRHRITALIVASALFMQSLDTSALGTALPAIGVAFGEDPVRLHHALTAYILALAVFMPASGWMADRFGTRTMFRIAVVVFAGASVACAFAGSLGPLVAARVVQGIGGAMMVPIARLALLRAVPKGEIVRAMQWVSIPALVAPVAGPPLSGFIVTYLDWTWIFWINLPIGIVGIVLASIYFEDVREPDQPKFDLLGFLIASVGITGLVAGTGSVSDPEIPTWMTIALLGVAAACAGLYLVHARRAASPIIDLALLRIPTFRASIAGGFLFRIGIGAFPFLMPLMLQTSFGRSPLESGSITFAAAAGALAMKFGTQPLLARFGFRPVLVWNGLFSAASIGACALFGPATGASVIFAVLLIGGTFRSLEFTALNAIGYAELDRGQMSRATSFAAMGQQLALSMGVGIGALALSVGQMARGADALALIDFRLAFATVGLIMLLSLTEFLRLAPGAGAEVAGRAQSVGGDKRHPSDTRT